MVWNGTIKYQDLQQPPQTTSEGMTVWLETVSNTLWTYSDVVRCCPMPTHPICTSRLDPVPQPLSGLPELCPAQTHPSLLHSHLSSQRCWGARWVLGSSSQTPTTPASKCSLHSVCLPDPTCYQLTWSQCRLKGAVGLQEPQVRPAQRAMEKLPPVLPDRQDFREPDWTRPGIKLS